ncbi:adenylyl-sulfate kinase [Sanguibacter sp. YZGR15]|uniref:Adenylyl-sulfate kinase n=1 Tax=Sanguibacter suaedae TaxID=2795737 RepID=A0A934I6R5_9MICO|nr:adenylyl-sulfate kinase [Sanguibacter suaedae]
MPPVDILLVAGASGVGKTSVVHEVSAILRRSRVAHAVVDGDDMDASHPGPGESDRPWVTATNLAKVWATYRAVGQHRLVYVNTVSVLEAGTLTAAVDQEARCLGVLLEADPPTLAARLAARETGSEEQVHVARSLARHEELSASAPAWVLRVPTVGRSVEEVAAAVVAHTGWEAAAAARRTSPDAWG